MKNDLQHIRKLLELYYEGETTQEQERQLGEYFETADEVPADMEADRELFAALKSLRIPAGLEKQLSEAIDAKAADSRERHFSPLRRWVAAVSSVAVIAILAVAGLLVLKPFAEASIEEEPAGYLAEDYGYELTADQIANHAYKALGVLSRTLNTGTSSVALLTL